MARTYTIGEFASEFDITTRTIRFYESEGLLSPARVGNNRIYQEQDRVNLRLILRGKRLGFSLSESRDLIQMYDPKTGNRKQLSLMLAKIQEKRDQLEQQLIDIEVISNELDVVEKRCREALAKGQKNTPGKKHPE